MKITINNQSPDGYNLAISGIIIDNIDQMYSILKMIEGIKQGNKICVKEAKELYNNSIFGKK